jgi:hypothetical protein
MKLRVRASACASWNAARSTSDGGPRSPLGLEGPHYNAKNQAAAASFAGENRGAVKIPRGTAPVEWQGRKLRRRRCLSKIASLLSCSAQLPNSVCPLSHFLERNSQFCRAGIFAGKSLDLLTD